MDLDKALLPYQKEIIEDDSRFIIIEKSRRVGISWIVAGKAIFERIDKKQDFWFVSANLDTAKEFIRYCKDWAEAFNAAIGTQIIDTSKATTETFYMPNGSRIGVLSSNPTALRGLSGSVCLDEFAYSEQQEELLTAAQPVTTWAEGSLLICSTHNGAGTVFYDLCEKARRKEIPYKLYKIDLPRALEDGLALKIKGDHHKLLPDIKACNQALYDYLKSTSLNDDAFRQEFLAEPMSSQSLISAQEYDEMAIWDVPDRLDSSKVYRPLHIGIDVGRTKDLTVFEAFEEYENPKSTSEWDRYDYKCVCQIEIRNQPIPVQWEIIKPHLMHPSVSTAAIDQGAVGRSLADLVKDEFPSALMCSFTLPFKARIAERMKGFIQYKRVSLPKDTDTKLDFLSVKRKVAKNGGVSYDGGTKDSHADRFWAACLALEAACSSNAATPV